MVITKDEKGNEEPRPMGTKFFLYSVKEGIRQFTMLEQQLMANRVLHRVQDNVCAV